MRVIGLDPSLTATGISTEEGLVTVRTKPSALAVVARLERMLDIVERAGQAAEPGTGDVLTVIEAPGFAKGAEAGAHQRAGLWWLLVYELSIWGPVVEVTPTGLKKFATGRGNAKKPDMRMALFKRVGLDLADDNQVDAWWLRQLGLHLVGDPSAIALPAAQLDALVPVRAQLPAD